MQSQRAGVYVGFVTPPLYHDSHPGLETMAGQANLLSVRSSLAGSGAVSPGGVYSGNSGACESRYVQRINAPVHSGIRY